MLISKIQRPNVAAAESISRLFSGRPTHDDFKRVLQIEVDDAVLSNVKCYESRYIRPATITVELSRQGTRGWFLEDRKLFYWGKLDGCDWKGEVEKYALVSGCVVLIMRIEQE